MVSTTRRLHVSFHSPYAPHLLPGNLHPSTPTRGWCCQPAAAAGAGTLGLGTWAGLEELQRNTPALVAFPTITKTNWMRKIRAWAHIYTIAAGSTKCMNTCCGYCA